VPEDERIAAERLSEVETATNSRQILEIDSLQLEQPLMLSSARGQGQLRVALTLGTIAVAALVVVTFLMAGQVQRAGPISVFGFVLSLLLIAPPAAIALHLALTRVSVELTSQRVRVFERKGLLLSARAEWQSSEIESLRLVGSDLASLVSVVIEGRTGRTSVPLNGLGFHEARAALRRAGCRSVDMP
jgi:hypothetical protein